MRKTIILSIGGVLMAAGLVLLGVWISKNLDQWNAGKDYEELKVEFDVEPLVDVPQADTGPVEVPIDFEELQKQYPDIYAWIRIPGTVIDYPILQREGDNSYYLNHTYQGKKKTEGAIYTEDYNSKDFLDPNTVIYGHNMKNGSMFKALHKYKNRTFFDEHSEIIIYQKGKILTYKIFAAYTSDAKHLLLSYNLEDENVFLNYLNNVLTNSNKSSNINITIPVSSEDRIITLSTCNNNDAQRYLVQAVLLSIQE